MTIETLAETLNDPRDTLIEAVEDNKNNSIQTITDEDIKRMWIKLHTPIQKVDKLPERNEICPFCKSGKKFKKCECYNKYRQEYEFNYSKTRPMY